MDLIRIYYDEFGEGEEEQRVDEVTWNDLEMDKVFAHVNHTRSYIGEQVLYRRLREPKSDRDWEAYERKVRYLQQNEQARMKIEKVLSRIGKRSENYYLPGFLHDTDLWTIRNGCLYHILQFFLLFFGVLAVFAEKSIFAAGFLAVICINLVIYMRTKWKYEVYLYSLGSVRKLVDFCKGVLADKELCKVFEEEEVIEATKELNRVTKGIAGFEMRKRMSWTGDTMALLRDYMLGITLYDISVFNHIMKVLDKKQDKVMCLYQFAGEIDMINAVTYFRREHEKKVCIPEFCREQKISAQGLYHPLLKDAVSNDFVTSGRTLLSGANASGKSTFMKAIAINVILAQTIHTCAAQYIQLPGMQVMTSMALRDDILSGESYYIREVKYLKRMLDRVETGKTVMCVIDEMLKGTNTVERQAASEAILRSFANKQCFVLVASHDLELLNKLQNEYSCYYFDSLVGEKDIYFDYRLHKGIGGRSNAIALLKLLQYPESIVEYAGELTGMPYISGRSDQ